MPKAQLGRANGLVQLSVASGRITAPLLAGFLMGTLGLVGVIGLDLVTFSVALLTLLIVRFPEIKPRAADTEKPVWRELLTGWRYLAHRQGLLGLALLGTLYNFFNNFGLILTTPLLLTLGSEKMLGVILSVGGLGMVFGSIFVTAWGPAKRLVRVNLGFLLMSGVGIMLVGLRPFPFSLL